MNEILASARRHEIAELFLEVQKVNQSAVDFYTHNGFRVVGEESFRVGAQDYAALVMRLALRTAVEGRSKHSVVVIPPSLSAELDSQKQYKR